MWRLFFVLCLLLSSAVLAADSRGQLRVGITITGTGNSSVDSLKTIAGDVAEPKVWVPLPTERPAIIVSRISTPSKK